MPPVVRLTLAPDRASVSQARHWARDRADALRLPPLVVSTVELLTSELVANAVLHGVGTSISVDLSADPFSCTVEVRDGSDELPVLRTTGPEVPGGHGMRLVERLADSWGSDLLPGGGKAVWFSVLIGQVVLRPQR